MNARTVTRIGCLLSLMTALSGALADEPAHRRALVPDDVYRIQDLSEPQCSPDGQWVAYVATSYDRDADETRSAIWMVSWDGTQRVRLTTGANSTRAPRWSPDGRYLSFLSAPAGSDTAQLMLLDRRGGEARSLTAVKGEIADYAWSPDHRRIVMVVQDTPGSAADAPAGAPAKTPAPIVVTALHFKADYEGYLAAGTGQHLFLLDVESGRLDPLTHGEHTDELPAWSPDGRRIAFVRTQERGPDPDGMQDIELIDAVPGAQPARLLRSYAPGQQHLAWSPDSTALAFLQGAEPRYSGYIQDALAVVAVAGGAPRALGRSLDRAVWAPEFGVDGTSITGLVEDDGIEYPVTIRVADGSVEKHPLGANTVTAYSAAGGHVAVLASSDAAAAEIHALEGGALRRLTGHNDALMAEVELGAVEDLRFRSRDGTEIHGLMVKPAGYQPGRRYPTLLWIHGGPNGQDAHQLVFDRYPLSLERQWLAAEGYIVLAVNYRGSSGRGSAFSRAIAADWGHREVEDLLAAVDHVVARGIADPQRLGVGGWSYGGILTDYLIASDGRFKGAVSGAGSANQLSMYGSDQYCLQYNNELGPPWKNTALWLKVSYPFFHADRIHTPTLFLGGEKDFNVPIAGGEQMYQALRTLGIPATLVVYPGQFHLLARPSYIRDRAVRFVAWFNQYVRDRH